MLEELKNLDLPSDFITEYEKIDEESKNGGYKPTEPELEEKISELELVACDKNASEVQRQDAEEYLEMLRG